MKGMTLGLSLPADRQVREAPVCFSGGFLHTQKAPARPARAKTNKKRKRPIPNI
jgi:hypothetical protein